MIKDTIAANEAVTPNSQEMAVLKDTFPSCFHADGSFDIERFKEFLSDKVSVVHEGYELRFLGKNYARLLASLDTSTVGYYSILDRYEALHSCDGTAGYGTVRTVVWEVGHSTNR